MNDVRKPCPASLAACALALGALATACNLTPGNPDDAGEETDGTAGETNDVPTGGEPTGGGVAQVTIYDIQKGDVALDSIVSLKSVVAVAPIYVDGDGRGYIYVSEQAGGEYAGIQVFVNPSLVGELESEGKLVAAGDQIDLIGAYTEFYDTSQVTLQSVGDLTITGTAGVPAPDAVSASDLAGGAKSEAYESCLVSVEGAKVTAPVAMYGEFQVDDTLQVDDLFFLPAGGPEPPEGTQFTALVGILTYSFEQFKLAPRDCADFQGWDGCTTEDPTTDTNPDCGMGGEVTIFQVQQDEICAQETVTVSGVVSSGLTFKKDGFFVQDPAGGEYSGIFVFIGENNPNMIAVNIGDTVTITGAYDEFYGASQIEVAAAADVVVTGMGMAPAPAVVAPADIATGGAKAEAYEGVLVQVDDVTVAANLDFGEYTVDDELRVDDLFFATNDWPVPAPGDQFTSIVGPLAYSFNNTKIAPRTAADLTPAP